MTPFVGEIRAFAGTFAPRGWALCDGTVRTIRQYSALFSLLGTRFGGDGQMTFALPDLRARAPMHQGTGPGLTPRAVGETGGGPYVTLQLNEIPAHTHQAVAVASGGSTADPTANMWAEAPAAVRGGTQAPLYDPTPNVTMNPAALSRTGSSQAHNNLQPYLGLTYIIALEGIFPSRE